MEIVTVFMIICTLAVVVAKAWSQPAVFAG
jgi:hypothetical protein